MYRILCCFNTKTNRVEEDNITDSLERCLEVPRGVNLFRTFLSEKRIEGGERTLNFFLMCRRILTSLGSLTPDRMDLPQGIRNDITQLREMAEYINFDSGQKDELNREFADAIDVKTRILKAQQWATDLLQDPYKWFRRNALEQTEQHQVPS